MIPEYPLNLDLPLTHTLQCLKLHRTTSSWMLGRTFKALREFRVTLPPDETENHSRHEGPQVDLPACTTLELFHFHCSMDYHCFLSCPNVQILRWYPPLSQTFDLAAFNSLHHFLFNLSCLKNLNISVPQGLGIDSLIDFVFCGVSEHGVWREIGRVKVVVWFDTSSEASDFNDQTVVHQPRYEKRWKSFTVTVTQKYAKTVLITAYM